MPRKAKKNTQGAGTIRKRSDGRWEARVTTGINSGIGKPIRRSIYGDTQAAVRKKMTTILRELDLGTYQVPNKITVAAWMAEWLSTFCENDVKPLTLQSYRASIKNHIVPAIRAMKFRPPKGPTPPPVSL